MPLVLVVVVVVEEEVVGAALRMRVGSHSPELGPGNIRVGKRHAGGVKDSGRPS